MNHKKQINIIGLDHLHQKNIFHRDLKPSNLLYNNKGTLKICDMGLARKFSGSLKSYTPTVVTLWYRAPEVLLGNDQYSAAIDMWSVGCIFAELIGPLLMGTQESEQIDLIFRLFGTPTEEIWPKWKELKFAKNLQFPKHVGTQLKERIPRSALSEQGFNLITKMLQLDPNKRITATNALKHPWFKENPLPQEPDKMPTFPALNEISRETRRQQKKN